MKKKGNTVPARLWFLGLILYAAVGLVSLTAFAETQREDEGGEPVCDDRSPVIRAEMAVIYSRLADLAAAILHGIDPAEPVTPQPGDLDPSDPIPVPAPIEPPTVDI